MPYIGNVTTSSNVNGSQINNGTITGDKLSLPFDYDSATLYLDNTNNRVGILTASPSSTLTVGTGGVVSIPLASAATPSLVFGTDTNTGIYSPGADQVAISTNGTGRIFIDSTGKLGVGISSPAGSTTSYSVDVYGPVLARAAISAHQTNAGVFEYTGNETKIRSYGATSGTGSIIFSTGGGGGSADSEKLRITSGGLVGVGTSSPSVYGAQLAVIGGSIHADRNIGSAAAQVQFSMGASSGANFGQIGNTGTRWSLGYGATANTIGTEVLTWNSSGNVGIGTTSPARNFHVSATSANTYGIARVSGNNRSGQIEFATDSTVRAAIASASFTDELVFYTSASETERVRIDSSGRLLVGTSTDSGSGALLQAPSLQLSPNTATRTISPGLHGHYNSESVADDATATDLANAGYVYFTAIVDIVICSGDTLESAATIMVDVKETTVQSTILGGFSTTNFAVVNGKTGTDAKFNICLNGTDGNSYLAFRNRMGGTRRVSIFYRIMRTD